MPNKKGIVITKVCPSCGMSFESLQSRNKKYCSEKCRQEHKDLYTTYYCDVCNKEMIILKSRLKKLLCGKQKTLTCSIECAKKFKQTGNDVVCDNCGKIFHRRQQHINRHEHQFCSTKCQFEYQHKEKFEVRKCEICDTKFEVSTLSKQRFCSVECQGKWQSTQTGILNRRFKRKKVCCDICNKEFYIKNYKLNNEHHFCSIECSRYWFANVLSKTEESRNRSRQIMLNLLTSGKISLTQSKPQIIIDELLSLLNINNIKEFNIIYYCVDNYLPDNNLMIEVQGDYWHCNPLKFKDKMNDTQCKRVIKDKAKHTYIKNNFNIEVLYLWEHDIYNNLDLCQELIKKYVDLNGQLKNYHSFNYCLENGELKLNDNIIVPFQDMPKSEYHIQTKAS